MNRRRERLALIILTIFTGVLVWRNPDQAATTLHVVIVLIITAIIGSRP